MKKHDYNILSISGNARSGKDTLGNNIVKILTDRGFNCKTVSFANELKKSVDKFLIDQTGISAFTEDDEEKKIIRPFLVCWGTDIMRSINSQYWINKLEKQLSSDCIYVVTDSRFENELDWVKSNDGLSVFLSREGVEPANLYEEEENEKLKKAVDLTFHVGNFDDENLLFLTSNEILGKLINNKTYESWKATCLL